MGFSIHAFSLCGKAVSYVLVRCDQVWFDPPQNTWHKTASLTACIGLIIPYNLTFRLNLSSIYQDESPLINRSSNHSASCKTTSMSPPTASITLSPEKKKGPRYCPKYHSDVGSLWSFFVVLFTLKDPFHPGIATARSSGWEAYSSTFYKEISCKIRE